MSDDELSDDMQELSDLIAEYRSKEEEDAKSCPAQETMKDESDTENKIESQMDKILFGDKAKLIKNLEKAVAKSPNKNEVDNSKNYSDEEIGEDKHVSKRKAKKRKPVWADPDDENIQLGEVKVETKRTGSLNHLKMDKSYKEYLTSRFTRIVNQPKWASLDENNSKEGDDDDDELLRTVGFLEKPPEHLLTSGHLKMKKAKDLNRSTYGEGAISCIEFHPSSTAALVAGNQGVATIYAVDGTKNDKLHNIHFKKYPIKCAGLLPCGTKAIFGSHKPYAYLYDLINAKETRFYLSRDFGNLTNFKISPCGRYIAAGAKGGYINIYESLTFEIIRTLHQNDEVSSICFTSDSQRLIVSGRSSNVSVFSMRQQRLEHKFVDDGCIAGRAMDLSPNQRLLATGSNEGVVNVYDFEKVMVSKAPLPEKTLLNLRTAISCVRFNHSSELLAFSSGWCKDAVKIAHFPSATVYANFPGHMPKFGHVRTLAFSPHSAYFAMGTETACPLFRIKHFQNY